MESKEQIILGDLNCNYLSERNSMYLSQLKSSTLFDVILSNDPSKILKSGVVHIGISDHSMVFAVRKFGIPSKNTHKHVTTRSFKNFNANAFREYLKSAPWHSLRNCTTPDQMVEI